MRLLASAMLFCTLVASAADAARPEIFVQTGHGSGIHAVAYSPAGKLVATGAADKTIKLWDAATGRELKTFTGHAGAVLSVTFSPDGKMLASASRDKSVRLWDIANGKETRVFTGHTNVVFAVAFAPDGKTVVSGGYDRTLRLWDAANGRELRTIGHPAAVRSLAFSADGKFIVSGAEDKAVRVWTTEGRERLELRGHAGGVLAVGFSPDGRRVVSGSEDKTVRLWDIAAGKELRSFRGHGDVITTVALAPDGKILASGSYDDSVRLWDAGNGKELKVLRGHKADVTALAFSPDGQQLVSASLDHSARVWAAPSGEPVFALRGHANAVSALAIAPDGLSLVTANADDSARVWDLVSGRERRGLIGVGPAVAYSPDGKLLATAGEDMTVRLWEVASGRALRRFAGHTRLIHAVAFSPDGKFIASGGQDDTVRLWEVVSGRALRTLNGHQDSVRSLAFSPDGRTLASGSYDDTIRLWDVANGQTRSTLKGHVNRVSALAYSPDGKLIASAGEDQTVRLWDTTSGQELKVLQGHAGAVLAVAFSPDGTRLASTGRDRSVRLWDIASGLVAHVFAVPAGRMSAVAFTPNGRTLIAGGDDGALRLWDAVGGREYAGLYSFREGEWISITPEGFYQSSTQGGRYLNVRIGERVASIDQYLESYFRPDRVQLAMAGPPPALTAMPAVPIPVRQPETTAVSVPDLAPAPANIVSIKPAPEVAIVDAPTRLTTDQVTLKLKITDVGGGVGDVRLYLNGTAVVFDKSRTLQVAARPVAGQEMQYKLKLVPGRNAVRAVAFNADNSMQSADAVHEITVEIAVVKRPALHALVVGINEYENPKLQLSYAVADAKLFADTLREKSAGLFGAVNIKTLVTRAETTSAVIAGELKALRGRVGPEDLFVFYVASHGTVDEGEYFLITSNVGATSTRKLQQDALRQNDLKELIANVPATKKLVVLDTCNAGKLGEAIQVAVLTRGLSEDAALKLLSRAVGSTVISASSSVQEALEGYRNHGLFTWVVAEGLKGRADLNRDGYIKTAELADYVESEVPVLAEKVFKSKQFPNTSLSGTIFPVAKVR